MRSARPLYLAMRRVAKLVIFLGLISCVCAAIDGAKVSPRPSKGRVASLQGPQRHLFKFFTGGLTQLLWTDMNVSELNLNKICARNLQDTMDHIGKGSEWAFRIVDASSKSPSGVLDGTVTSFGDYDQCLEVQSEEVRPRFYGKHCMANFLPDADGLGQLNISQHVQERLPVFEFYQLNLGLCVPSTCRPVDVEKLLRHRLKGQPFTLTGQITCDTDASTSISNRLLSVTRGQVAAISYILVMVGLVVFATNYDTVDFGVRLLMDKKIEELVPPLKGLIENLSNFSIFKNSLQLVTVKRGQEKLTYVDVIKIFVVLGSIIGHCASAYETPLGFYVVHRLQDLKFFFGSWLTQPLLNLNIINFLSFLGGALTLHTTYDLIDNDLFSFKNAIFSKWLKFAPSVMSIVALDFVWPLIGNGPIFSRVSSNILDKCTKNWWRNLLFVSNSTPALEMCSAHTFYSSIYLQLFVVGLGVVFMLTRSSKAGIAVSLVLIAIGNLLTFENSKALSSPVFMDKDATVAKSASYVDLVIFPTSAHLSDYFVGLLCAYFLRNKAISIGQTTGRLFTLSTFALVLLDVLLFSSGYHNVLSLLASAYYSYYVMAIKTLFTVLFAVMFIWLSPLVSLESSSSEGTNEEKIVQDADEDYGALDGDMVVSLPKAFAKLSLSLYMVSAFYIRFDFFTTRLLYVVNLYNVVKRGIYTLVYTFLLALIFQLFFVSPFDNIRKSLDVQAEIPIKPKDD